MKATAVAHPIQGLIKYHGLKDRAQRIPYHDSISVCVQALSTTTTVEASGESREDEIRINGKQPLAYERERVETVLNRFKEVAKFDGSFRIASQNSLEVGKGLGFSASGFAALGMATSKALHLDFDPISLSEIVRLGAGSATRSLAGGFAVWYADREGRSYAERLKAPEDFDFSMVIVPVHSEAKTDEAHLEVLSSCLFESRLKNVGSLVETMKEAIDRGDTATVGKLAEEDTLNLHATTMTGKSHMVLWEPDTVRVIKEVVEMREEGTPAWYSIDTGPSVFINTLAEHTEGISTRLRKIGFKHVVTSGIGEKPLLTLNHVF